MVRCPSFRCNLLTIYLQCSCRADAGDATQGVPGGRVYKMRVVPPTQRRRGRRVAYVVFEGLAPGVYDTWQDSFALQL